MIKRFYDFNEICAIADCKEIANDHGIKIQRGRCKAVWRNGDNPNAVAVKKDKFFDHVKKNGGSVIDFTAKLKFNGNIQLAQQYLGDKYNLTPKLTVKHEEYFSARIAELKKPVIKKQFLIIIMMKIKFCATAFIAMNTQTIKKNSFRRPLTALLL